MIDKFTIRQQLRKEIASGHANAETWARYDAAVLRAAADFAERIAEVTARDLREEALQRVERP